MRRNAFGICRRIGEKCRGIFKFFRRISKIHGGIFRFCRGLPVDGGKLMKDKW